MTHKREACKSMYNDQFSSKYRMIQTDKKQTPQAHT